MQTSEFATAYPLIVGLPDGSTKAEIEQRLGEKMSSVLFMSMVFESIGILVQRCEVPIDLVEDFYTGPILVSWRKLESYAADLRTEAGPDTPLEYFQWIAEQIGWRRAKHPTPPAYEEFRAWQV